MLSLVYQSLRGVIIGVYKQHIRSIATSYHQSTLPLHHYPRSHTGSTCVRARIVMKRKCALVITIVAMLLICCLYTPIMTPLKLWYTKESTKRRYSIITLPGPLLWRRKVMEKFSMGLVPSLPPHMSYIERRRKDPSNRI